MAVYTVTYISFHQFLDASFRFIILGNACYKTDLDEIDFGKCFETFGFDYIEDRDYIFMSERAQ